jgi:hypothetical protein
MAEGVAEMSDVQTVILGYGRNGSCADLSAVRMSAAADTGSPLTYPAWLADL